MGENESEMFFAREPFMLPIQSGVWMVGLVHLHDFKRSFIFGCIKYADTLGFSEKLGRKFIF